MARKIHVAVIDTDVPVPAVYAARGLYSSQFRVLLQAAAARLNNNSHVFDDKNPTRSGTSSNEPLGIHTTAYDAVGGSLPPAECLRLRPYRRGGGGEDGGEENNGPTGPIDAILITGSSASAYAVDKYPWIPALESFIHMVYTDYPHVKIFGSCFGHQIVAKALLEKKKEKKKEEKNSWQQSPSNQTDKYLKVESCPAGYEIGIHPITLNSTFTAHFTRRLPQLSKKDIFRIQLIHGDRVVSEEYHHDHIYNSLSSSSSPSPSTLPPLPDPWINFGCTPLSPIQGLYHPRRVLTYQVHFEFDRFVNRETCCEFARRAGWSGPFLERALERIMDAHDDIDDVDVDDSRLAAEMVVLFFAAEDGVDSSIGFDTDIDIDIDVATNADTAVRVNGMITPPAWT